MIDVLYPYETDMSRDDAGWKIRIGEKKPFDTQNGSKGLCMIGEV